MIRTLTAFAVVILAAACGVPPSDDEPEPHLPNDPPAERFDPGCGTYADPNLSVFNGCRADTVGQLARVDTADGPEVYRCTEDGMQHVDGRCRFYDEDLWCGCGVDDGAGPAP